MANVRIFSGLTKKNGKKILPGTVSITGGQKCGKCVGVTNAVEKGQSSLHFVMFWNEEKPQIVDLQL
jgi:hypothetical protein